IVKVQNYEKIQGRKDSVNIKTEEVLKTDKFGRPVSVLISRPINRARKTLVPYLYSEVHKDIVNTKGVLFFRSDEMSKIYSTYTYSGDTQVTEIQMRIVGRDTVEKVQITYNSAGNELQQKYWVYLDAQTTGISVFINTQLVETQTWINGKKTEHSSYKYKPKSDWVYSENSYDVFSLMSDKPILKFTIKEISEGFYEITPAGKLMYTYHEDQALEVISQDLFDTFPDDFNPQVKVMRYEIKSEGQGKRFEYRQGGSVIYTVVTDESGMIKMYQNWYTKTYRTYTFGN
ncbi:MAG: hypothetical protein ACRC3B_02905, partial [Bacteroidia bacterium]